MRGYVNQADIINYALTEEKDKIADKYASKISQPQPSITHYSPLAKVECPIEIGRYPTSRFSASSKTNNRPQASIKTSYGTYPSSHNW